MLDRGNWEFVWQKGVWDVDDVFQERNRGGKGFQDGLGQWHCVIYDSCLWSLVGRFGLYSVRFSSMVLINTR